MKLDMPKPVIWMLILAVLILFGFLIPQTFVLAEGELFNEQLTFQSNLFNLILFGSSIGLMLVFGAFYLWKKNDKHTDNLGFAGDGKLYGTQWWHKFDPLQRLIISFLLMGFVFSVSTFLRLGTFTQLRFLPQQFTPAKSLIFSTLMIPISENVMAQFVIALTVLLLTIVAIRYDVKHEEYKWYILISVPLILGSLAMLWHRTAYAGSDNAYPIIFVFWAIGGLMSIYLEDAIPFIIAHMYNNFFIDFTRLFTSDSALFTVLALIFGIPILIWFLVYGFKFTPSKT